MERNNMNTRNAKRLNLQQCIRLQQNNFLNSDMTETYDHEEVISQMIKLQSDKDIKKLQKLRKQERQITLSETPPPIPHEAMIDYVEEINF